MAYSTESDERGMGGRPMESELSRCCRCSDPEANISATNNSVELFATTSTTTTISTTTIHKRSHKRLFRPAHKQQCCSDLTNSSTSTTNSTTTTPLGSATESYHGTLTTTPSRRSGPFTRGRRQKTSSSHRVRFSRLVVSS
eukprot:PhF_6_TR26280/c0_g1_i1/m.37650